MAVGAFFITGKIEDHINGVKTEISKERKYLYAGVSAIPLVLIVLVWITPSKKEYVWNQVEEKVAAGAMDLETMDIDQLAFELIHHAHEYNLIDVRDTSAFKESIPTAINIPLQEMDAPSWNSVFKQPYKKNIFIGDNPEAVRKAGVMATFQGDEDPAILDASVSAFRTVIYNPVDPGTGAPRSELDTYRFRQDAKIILTRMEERLKNLQQPVKRIIKKVEGGCM